MRFPSFLLLAAGVAFATAGCNSTTAPSADLTGTYGLVSVQFGTGAALLVPPTEEGSFALSATTYNLTLTGSVPETDAGTYTATGTSWSEVSSTTAQTYTGTYALSGSILTITTVQQGVTVVAVWQKLT
ncbi:MAG TPA: hypothetical protein VK688_08290 [Gemmatimonadales bacterium]|nr:hypothetical protein [Gemmatimonadales bacterium]